MAKKTYYLGDPEFTKKMMKMYAWIMPFIFMSMTLLLLYLKCWVPALLFLVDFFIVFPPFKKYMDKVYIKGVGKFAVCAFFIYLALSLADLYM